MTEIERYHAPTEVDSWAPMMSDVIKLADYVSETEFVPKALRGKPPAIAASILAGREAGIPPMRALSHIHMVDGRPSMSAEQKRAQALAAGHEIVYVETTSTRCVVKGRRKDSEIWSTVTWTMDDAQQAGLANKENYRKHPRRMLQARGTGELCDMLFPDATAGLATTEEIQDGGDATGVETEGQTRPRPRTAQRKTAAKKETSVKAVGRAEAEAAPEAKVPEPPLPGEDDDGTFTVEHTPGGDPVTATVEEPDEQMVTKAQLTKIAAAFGELDVTDRDQRLRYASVITGRPLETSKELTKEEAGTLIDTLEHVVGSDDPHGNLEALVETVQRAEAASDTGTEG